MKINYTGRQVALAPAQLKKIEAAAAKAGKLLDGKEEREAHVILAQERHLHKAEITVNYFGHQIVVSGSNADLFTAINGAFEKLQKQAVKLRAKWRAGKRTPRKERVAEAATRATAAEAEAEPVQKVYRVNHHQRRKPMTVDEAMLELGKDRDYLVYRDAETDRISVLLRRRDGHFDLVES